MPILENNHFVGRRGDSFGILAYRDNKRQTYGEEIAAYLDEKAHGDTLWLID